MCPPSSFFSFAFGVVRNIFYFLYRNQLKLTSFHQKNVCDESHFHENAHASSKTRRTSVSVSPVCGFYEVGM